MPQTSPRSPRPVPVLLLAALLALLALAPCLAQAPAAASAPAPATAAADASFAASLAVPAPAPASIFVQSTSSCTTDADCPTGQLCCLACGFFGCTQKACFRPMNGHCPLFP